MSVPQARVGFVGIGKMGQPMAQRLLAAGVPLVVWNRTAARCAPLVAQGARLATAIDAVFQQCDVILLMLLDERAVDAALARGTPAFADRVRGRIVVLLGTTSPRYSVALDADIRTGGGRYVEAPVSGSRTPAETGSLVGMVAGAPEDVARVRPLLGPLCREIVTCGAVPAALTMKLAVNHYLVVLVAALAEAVAAADASGVDLQLLRMVLDTGPMASLVSRSKLDKLLGCDFVAQADIGDVARIAALVREQARAAKLEALLIAAATLMFEAACSRGLAAFDMIAVLQPSQTSALDIANAP